MTIDELLEQPYILIDILPEQVPYKSPGRYFDVEKFYLSPSRYEVIREKFASILLRLCCYYDLSLMIGEADEILQNPDPAFLFDTVRNSDQVLCLFAEDALITLKPDDLYMTVYNADARMKRLLEPLALAEGFFMREPEQA